MPVDRTYYTFDGDELAFDLVTSNGTDNSTQIVVKSTKPINANTTAFEYFEVDVALNDEVFAIAA